MTAAPMPRYDTGLDALPAIGIDALESRAALLTRSDRKYLLELDMLLGLFDQVATWDIAARALEIDGRRWFGYESVYFDTPERRSFHLAATGRPRRFKVRTRAYLDSGFCMTEVKERNRRNRTVKHRAAHPFDLRSTLTCDDHAFLFGFPDLIGRDDAKRLGVALTTRYQRATLFAPASGSRVTIDLGLHCTTPDGRSIGLPDHAIIETKSVGAPTGLDRWLWTKGVRPTKVSKYATGLAALHPELPANRWSRVLHRYFGRPRTT